MRNVLRNMSKSPRVGACARARRLDKSGFKYSRHHSISMQPKDADTNEDGESQQTKAKPPIMAGRYRRRGHPDIARWKREGKTITTLGTMGDVVKALGGDSDGEEE